MKKITQNHILVFSLIFILFSGIVNLLSWERWTYRAPELFGDANALALSSGSSSIAVIESDGFVFLLAAGEDHCSIRQMTGPQIGGAENPIPCKMQMRNGERFAGWIDFRGHPRPFCGARPGKEFPARCRLGN